MLIGFGAWARVLYPRIRSVFQSRVFIAVPSPGNLPLDQVPSGAPVLEADPRRFPASIDTWFIATPYAAHFDWVLEGLGRGAAVFCEKPLHAPADRVRTALALLERGRCVFRMNFVDFWNPAFRKLCELVPTLAGPTGISMYYSGRYRLHSSRQILWELGPHALACAMKLTGRLKITGARADDQQRTVRLWGGTGAGEFRVHLGAGEARRRQHLVTRGDHCVRFDGNGCCVAELWRQSNFRCTLLESHEYTQDPVLNAIQAFHLACLDRAADREKSAEAFAQAATVDSLLRGASRLMT